MQKANLRAGCTSFLSTLITATDEFIYQAITTMEEFLKIHENQVFDLNIEGPYISKIKKVSMIKTLFAQQILL